MYISQIFVYPIKSLGGIELQRAEVDERGLRHDRRWVLADENFHFMTQRERPEMAFFEVSLHENGLRVLHRQQNVQLDIPFLPQTNDTATITIWDDAVQGIRVSDEADAWFSALLGTTCSLYFQPDDSVRLVDSSYAIHGTEHTSFADGYPILVVGQASLDDLNAKTNECIEMARFRPNLVVEGGKPFEEDTLRIFSVGTARLAGVKPCARCVLTTLHPTTAVKGKEPLATLSTYRKVSNKILFGQNVLVHQTGVVSVGDELV
jgi:uncharacterized protein